MSDSDTGSDDYCSDEDRDDEYVAAVASAGALHTLPLVVGKPVAHAGKSGSH